MKQYQKPMIEVIFMDTENVIAVSLPVNGDKETDTMLKDERRRNSAWDEYEKY